MKTGRKPVSQNFSNGSTLLFGRNLFAQTFRTGVEKRDPLFRCDKGVSRIWPDAGRLAERVVALHMIAEWNVDPLPFQPLKTGEEFLPAVKGKAIAVQKLRRHGVDADSAVHGRPVFDAFFLGVEEKGHGSGGMARGRQAENFRGAEADDISVVKRVIRLECLRVGEAQFPRPCEIQRAVGVVDVVRAEKGLGMREFEQVPGCSEMIVMAVGMDHMTDVPEVESEFPYGFDDVMQRVRVSGIQQNQTLFRRDQVGGGRFRSDEVDVAADFERFDVIHFTSL